MIIITKYYLPETSLVQAGTSEQSVIFVISKILITQLSFELPEIGRDYNIENILNLKNNIRKTLISFWNHFFFLFLSKTNAEKKNLPGNMIFLSWTNLLWF